MAYQLQELQNLLWIGEVHKMVSLFCFAHLVGQLAEAHIVSWFELGRVQLDLLSQLDQAWRGSQTAL